MFSAMRSPINAKKARFSANVFGEREAVGVGHVSVEQHERERLAAGDRRGQFAQGIVCVLDDRRTHPPVLQHLFEDAAVRGVVIDDEYPQVFEHDRHKLVFGMLMCLQLETRGEVERTAASDFALDPDLTMHQAHEPSRNRQPRAYTSERAVISRSPIACSGLM